MIKNIFRKKTHIGFIFLILLVYSLYNFLCLCKFFPHDTFDSQLLVFWDYMALHNIVPNNDIMYPYGLLSFYKNTSIFFSIIYILLFPTLSILVFLALEKIIKNKVLIFSTFFSFIFFIFKYTGIEVFSRYGLLLGISVILSLAYNKYLYIPRFYSFFFGCLIGFIFSIINDVGLYMFSLFLFFSFLIPIFKNGVGVLKTHRYYIRQTFNATFFSIGILIGLLPILFLFIGLENLATVFGHSRYLFDFPIYSKTPFLPSLRSTENIFIFTVMIFTIFLLFYKRIILKEKSTLLSYFQLGIIFSLFLLLQKSVIRSIDTQITFLGFFLYVFLILELINFLKNRISFGLLYVCYLLALFFLFNIFGLRNFSSTGIYSYKPVEQNLFGINIKSLLKDKQSLCLSRNLDMYRENRTYKDILSFVRKNAQGEKPFIFDYLTDPIFYILFNQPPPFYFEVFASSPSYSQESNIKYIKDNRVKYVIYNTDALRIRDDVPDYARESILFKHIINNFRVWKKIDTFIILRKIEEDYDLFQDNDLAIFPDFKNYLLNINLGSIPRSEGIYKTELLKSSKMVGPEYPFNSKDKVLLVKSKNGHKNKKLRIRIVSDLDTTVEFDSCIHNNQCVINLANIPLFYRGRVIKKINYDSNAISRIEILDGIPKGIF